VALNALARTPMMTQPSYYGDADQTNRDLSPRLQEARMVKYELTDNIVDYIKDFEIIAECNG
jgi:hypothetical protein